MTQTTRSLSVLPFPLPRHHPRPCHLPARLHDAHRRQLRAPTAGQRAEETLPTQAELRDALAKIREAYVALDQAAYRLGIFSLLGGLGPEDGSQALLDLAEATLTEGEKSGLDGIEVVFLYAVDGLYAFADKDHIEALEALIDTYPEQRFVVGAPNAGFIVPLGRASTSVFLDLRADAARILVERVLADGHMIGGLDALLDDKQTRGDLCDLEARGDSDRGVAIGGFQRGLDQQRKQECEEDGAPGGAGAGGGVSGGLGNVAEGACFDPNVDFGKEDPTAMQILDLAACAESVRPDRARGPGNMTLGPVVIPWIIANGIKVAAAVKTMAPVTIGAATATIGWYWNWHGDQEKYEDTISAYHGTIRELHTAILAAEATKTALDLAQAALDLEQENLDNALDSGDEALIAEAQKSLDDAQKAYDAAKAAHDKAVADAQDKLDATQKAAQDVERARKDAEGAFGPDDPYENTPECESALNNVFDGTEYERDHSDALAEADPEKGTNPWVTRYTEDSDFGVDGLGMMPCGMDPATIHPSAAACDGLVSCPPDEPHCACSIDTDIGEAAALFAGAADSACAMVISCPDDTEPSVGELGCGCEGEQPDIDIDEIGPDFTGPTPRFLQGTFASRAVVEQMTLSTSERALVGAVRDDVGVGEVMTEDFGG